MQGVVSNPFSVIRRLTSNEQSRRADIVYQLTKLTYSGGGHDKNAHMGGNMSRNATLAFH